MEPQDLFVDHLDLIEKLTRVACRKNGLVGDEADDFRSEVLEKLIADDYAVLRKFRGTSSLATYLSVVIANLLRDHRVRKWGKWRASAAARKLGPQAVELERLIGRDGLSLEEAVTLLSTNGGSADSDLRRLAARLPVRLPRIRVGEESLARVASTDMADDGIEDAGRSAVLQRANEALERGLDILDPDDRALVKMRFWDAMKVSDIARMTGLPQRGLYTRLNGCLDRLRTCLEAEGLNRDDIVAAVLGISEA